MEDEEKSFPMHEELEILYRSKTVFQILYQLNLFCLEDEEKLFPMHEELEILYRSQKVFLHENSITLYRSLQLKEYIADMMEEDKLGGSSNCFCSISFSLDK